MAVNLPDRQSTSIEYRKMKLGVANCLTVNDTISLATMFNFAPAAIDQLESSKAPGLMLLRVLEQYKIVTESKVNELEDALVAVNQDRAGEFVKQYKREVLGERLDRRGSESSLASEDSGIAASSGVGQQMLSLNFEEADLSEIQTVEAFCNKCNQVISWRDVARDHSSHRDDVIAGENLPEEIAKKKSTVSAELDALSSKLQQSQEAVSDMNDGQIGQMMEEVTKLAEDFVQKVELRKKELMDELRRSQRDRDADVKAYESSVQEMIDMCNDLKEEISVGARERGNVEADSMLRQLMHLNDIRQKLDTKREGVNTALKSLQENRCRVFLRCTTNDGQFAELMESTLAGILWILTDQLVMVFDERRTRRRIEVKCFEGPDAAVESWTKIIDVDHLDGNVAVSAIEYYRGPHPHILLAVGKTVFMLQLSYDGYHFDGVCETKSYELKLSSNAYVTSISAHEQGSRHKDKFVVSTNTSSKVYHYNGVCELDREIDCSELVSSIMSISCVDDSVAVVDNLSKKVVIIGCDSAVPSVIAILSTPSSDVKMLPWAVLWTGALWLILWVPDKNQTLKWCVSSHNEDGSKVQLYEGTFSRMSFPAVITRYIYGIMLGFSDSSIHKFEQV